MYTATPEIDTYVHTLSLRDALPICLELARSAGSAELEAAALGGRGDAEYMRGHMMAAHDRFRRCVELSRAHGFGRIEVANLPMAAITRWYAGDRKSTRLTSSH